MATRIKMLVTQHADPTTQTILVAGPTDPVMVGEGGPVTYICGRCERDLLVDVAVNVIQNIVIQCGCGAYNLSEL